MHAPFCFDTGYAASSKRPSRPLPAPFSPRPTASFSEPLTHPTAAQYRGRQLRGLTNGDDALVVADNYLGVDDGVGAWATRPHGNAA